MYFGNLHFQMLEKYFPKRFRLLKIFTIIKQTHLCNLMNNLITYLERILEKIFSIFLEKKLGVIKRKLLYTSENVIIF